MNENLSPLTPIFKPEEKKDCTVSFLTFLNEWVIFTALY
jgi:hypothetical protein